MLILQYTKRRLLVVDLVAAFVLFIFMLVLLCFLRCYRFSANKDLYIAHLEQTGGREMSSGGKLSRPSSLRGARASL